MSILPFIIRKKYFIDAAILLLLSLASFLLYKDVLRYFFLQDDWFHLRISNANNFKEILDFFAFRSDIIAWRPVSKQFFFLLIIKVFNYNYFYAHVLLLVVHIVNSFLLYKIILKTGNRQVHAIISSFLYATASFNFTPLAWISAGEYTIGTLFFLLASYFFLFYQINKHLVLYFLMIVMFFFSLASTELAITWPVFIVLLVLISTKNKIKLTKILNVLIIPVLVICLYLFLRIVLFNTPITGDYEIVFGANVIKNLIWFTVWVLNIPENFMSMITLFPFKISNEPTFVEYVNDYLPKLLISIAIFTTSCIFLLINCIAVKNIRIFVSIVLVYILSLAPVLFFTNHAFAHYLIIPSIGVFIFMGYLLSEYFKTSAKMQNKIIVFIVVCASWYASSYSNVSYAKRVHWIPSLSSISQLVASKIENEIANVPTNSTIVLDSPGQLAHNAMMNQEGLKILLKDQTIKTSYVNVNPNRELAYYLNIFIDP